MLIGFFLVCCC